MKKRKKKTVTPIQKNTIRIPEPDIKFQGIPVSLFSNYGESAWSKWLDPMELVELEIVRRVDEEFPAFWKLRRTALNRRNEARTIYDEATLERTETEYNESQAQEA